MKTALWYAVAMCALGAAASMRPSAAFIAPSAGLAAQDTTKNRHYGRPLGLGRSTG